MAAQILTESDIDNMPAGRDMDALIAEHVFGKRVWFEKGNPTAWKDGEPIMWFPNDYVTEPEGVLYLHVTDGHDGMIQHYSADIRTAWSIEQEGWSWYFLEAPSCLNVALDIWVKKPRIINLHLDKQIRSKVGWQEVVTKQGAYALGRCRAALKAVLLKDSE